MTIDTSTLYCENHPKRETSLRCNRCNKPICAKCAVSTPTGYRCPQCVRGQQKTFDSTEWYDYPAAFFVALILSFIGSQLVQFIGFFTILLAPVAGIVIAEAVRLVVRKRRSKRLFQVATIGAADWKFAAGIRLCSYFPIDICTRKQRWLRFLTTPGMARIICLYCGIYDVL